ncbi:MAG TPA: hypothetical protein PKA49_16325 [Tepidiformaceae bacterium]|nr:hypothetical protein [Tepidiformaceae bacterium]
MTLAEGSRDVEENAFPLRPRPSWADLFARMARIVAELLTAQVADWLAAVRAAGA